MEESRSHEIRSQKDALINSVPSNQARNDWLVKAAVFAEWDGFDPLSFLSTSQRRASSLTFAEGFKRDLRVSSSSLSDPLNR